MKYMCVKKKKKLVLFYIFLGLNFKLLDQNKYLYIFFENRKIKTKINICFYIYKEILYITNEISLEFVYTLEYLLSLSTNYIFVTNVCVFFEECYYVC